MKKILIPILTIFTLFFVACSNGENADTQSKPLNIEQDDVSETVLPEETISDNSEEWIAINDDGLNITLRINTPPNFKRIEVLEESFAAFVRNYPLKDNDTLVHLYNGNKKHNQNSHIAVFDMHLVEGDLQQCADSIMRMYAEYYYNQKQFDKIAFHFVNGFLCDFEHWSNGYRVDFNGNETSFVKKADYSENIDTFENYLRMVFSYASTLSMEQESEIQEIEDLKIGDVFLKSGSPGHVVMVVDVCENDEGEKAFLLAQGYMPAQDFHILKNPANEQDPWYYVEDVKYPFKTPEYTFSEQSFRELLY